MFAPLICKSSAMAFGTILPQQPFPVPAARRYSHFKVEPWVEVGFTKENATSYLKASSDSYEHKNKAYDLGVVEIVNTGGDVHHGDYAVKLSKSKALAQKAGNWKRGAVTAAVERLIL